MILRRNCEEIQNITRVTYESHKLGLSDIKGLNESRSLSAGPLFTRLYCYKIEHLLFSFGIYLSSLALRSWSVQTNICLTGRVVG